MSEAAGIAALPVPAARRRRRTAGVRRGRRRDARSSRIALVVPALAVLVMITCIGALCAGAVRIAPLDVAGAMLHALGVPTPGAIDAGSAALLLHVRLPRVLLGAGVGAVLGLCGCAMQGLFRNPLADPSLIGVSAGAAAAVVTATVLERAAGLSVVFGSALAPAAGFAGALLATALVHRLSLRDGRILVATMLLAGVAVNALAGAATALLIHFANDAQLRTVTFWTMGSVSGATWRTLAVATPIFALSAAALLPLAGRLNAMMLGEAEAGHLGIDVEATKRRILGACSLGVAAAVAASGIIGFVALAAPHLLRLACGPDHRRTMAGSALLGAALLVAADVAARTLAAPAELPIGALTALAGSPLLLWLLRGQGRHGAA